jgi:hypothetical protein
MYHARELLFKQIRLMLFISVSKAVYMYTKTGLSKTSQQLLADA